MWQAESFFPYPPIVARCETTFSFTRITTNGSTEPTPSRRVPSGALPGTWQHLHPRTGWLPSSFCFYPAAFDQLPKPADTRYGPASVAGGGKERRKLAGIARPPRPVVEETTTGPFRAPSPGVVASLNSDAALRLEIRPTGPSRAHRESPVRRAQGWRLANASDHRAIPPPRHRCSARRAPGWCHGGENPYAGCLQGGARRRHFEGLLLKQHYSGSSKDPSLGQAYKVVST